MCKTCKGKGGLVIEHKWGIQFESCPDSHCDFEPNDDDIEILRNKFLKEGIVL